MVLNFLRFNYPIEHMINVLLHLVIDLRFCFTFKTKCFSFLSTWMIHSEHATNLIPACQKLEYLKVKLALKLKC